MIARNIFPIDLILCSTVTPADRDNDFMTSKKVWLPPGVWVERNTLVVYDVKGNLSSSNLRNQEGCR